MRKLKAMILLYAYCWLEFYGGIDPECVAIDFQGNVSLNDRFSVALKCSQTDGLKTVMALIKSGHFNPVECWFEKDMFGREIYMGDAGTYTPAVGVNVAKKIILRPTWLIQSKLDSEAVKNKKGKVVL